MPQIVAVGQLTINDTNDGLSAVLSNEGMSLPSDSNGVVSSYVGCSTTMFIYVGGKDDSVNWTVTATPSNGVVGSFGTGVALRTYTVSSLTVNSAYIDFSATKVGVPGSATIVRRFSLSISQAGANGADGTSVKGDPGAAGAEGLSYVKAYCASSTPSTTTAPPNTKGRTSLPPDNSGGLVGTYTVNTPLLSDGQRQYQTDGTYNPITDYITWSVPYWSVFKAGDLSSIINRTGTLIVTGSISSANGNFTVDSLGQVTAKAITIAKADGTIILSSGTTLNPAYAATGTLNSDLTPAIQQAAIASFSPYKTWEFRNSSEGWSPTRALFTNGAESLTIASDASTDPYLSNNTVSFSGAKYDKLRMRVKRKAGSGWQGQIFYQTSVRAADSGTYSQIISVDPTSTTEFRVLEWDMLTSTNPSDWTGNVITRLRFDLGTTPADIFEIDWISVGRYGVGSDELNNYLQNLELPYLLWDFNNTVDGWSGNSTATVTPTATTVTWTPTVPNPVMNRGLGSSEQFKGSDYPKVRARVRRVSGAASWEGSLYYSTSASGSNHGSSNSFYKTTPAPVDLSQWSIVEWDMSTLTVGGTDWLDNVITNLRIDISNVADGSVWEFDWISVGRFAYSVSPADVAATQAAITAISSDNVLSKGEKSQVILDWAAISGEKTGIDTQADSLLVSRTAYDNAYAALNTYLGTVAYNDTTTDTTIVGSDFRTNFTNYYTAKQALLNAMAAKAATMASGVTISAGGVLSGAGGGAVTITGLGYTGHLAATKNVVTSSATAPASPLDGDIWVDTNIPVTIKTRVAGAWVVGGKVPTALSQVDSNADTKLTGIATGATKNVVSQGTTAARPVGADGDFYYDTDAGVLYQKTGGAWIMSSTVGAPAGTLVSGVLASTVATAATNFNASNDRNSAAITDPTILTDGTSVDHTIRNDGAADISFEWNWSGNEGDIDGFMVYVYQSPTSAIYTFGTTPSAETVYTVPASKRAFLLFGVAADQYTKFGVRAYRSVDKDINATGVIKSNIVVPSLAAENPYQPSTSVAFAGNIIGTINNIPAANVNVWSSISGLNKPADNATSDIVLVGRGVTINGNNLVKSGATSAFDSDAYSTYGYVGGAYASAIAVDTTHSVMFGLNSDPLTDSDYRTIDYAMYLRSDGAIWSYQSGTSSAVISPSYAAGDVLSVTYDGTAVRWLKNGTILRTVVVTITDPLFFDSSFNTPGAKLAGVRFSPMSSNNWANIGGANKPQDGATVGATLGVNVTGTATSVKSLSPTLGTFTSAGTARTEISDLGIRVYDGTGALRIKIGIL